MTFRPNNITPKITVKSAGLLVILVMVLTLGGYYYSRMLLPGQAVDETVEQTAAVRRGDLVLSASGTGTLIPQTDATFGFETSGQVTRIYVKPGDQIEAGQLLAELDDTLARMEYIEAQQALEELYSAASIATVQQEIGTAKDAEFYAREWLEYLLSPDVVEAEENLAIAEQNLAEAQAEAKTNSSEEASQKVKEREDAVAYLKDKLAQAQTYYQDVYVPEEFGVYENVGSRRYPRYVLATTIDPDTGEEAPDIHAPSIADIAAARNEYVQAQEIVREGEMYLEALTTGVIPEGATGEKLNDLYKAQVALDAAKSMLEETRLVAPISGTITSFDIRIGEQADTSASVTISQLSQPYVLDVYLDEADWSAAQVGNTASVTFDLLPEQTFPATVTLVYPELIASTNSSFVHVLVQLDRTVSQNLPVGTGASVEIIAVTENS